VVKYWPVKPIIRMPVCSELLIHKIKDDKELAWYAEQTIEQGWSRLTLERYPMSWERFNMMLKTIGFPKAGKTISMFPTR